jgi:phage recombination protein Bet
MSNSIINKETAMVLTDDQKDLIKRTVANGCTDDELSLFLYQCERSGLDPFSRQIHMIKRGNRATIQTGIDGYRAIAERTGKYAGNDEYLYNGGQTEYQLLAKGERQPKVATACVRKIVGGVVCDFKASASWLEYCPKGKQDYMWNKMPYLMLGKCAEALALRKAFPNDLSGIYTDDEMAQAEVQSIETKTKGNVDDLKRIIAPVVGDTPYEDFDRENGDFKPEEEEEERQPTLIDQIRECLGSKYVSDETRDKVGPWLEKSPNYDAVEICLNKLRGMIDEGEKAQKEEPKKGGPGEDDDDLPF